MTTSTLPATLSFHQTELRIIDRDGNPWITAADLAKALGYSRSDNVTKVYERNADEFTDQMTLNVKLTVNGFGNGVAQKDTRIFSTRGCHLIAMFARTHSPKSFAAGCWTYWTNCQNRHTRHPSHKHQPR